ncbi:GNAT family N-acetyltransferase [Paenibacillus methanolicus]|uniref:Acetyltransferase (GNAT) family protein n=1 Tax=Paenibacillus methanolicus TaxID=582686 RepID=A0A5S5CHL8_9BACL|nr:GNAT family N-acetyltransferase [Paenibacillus methanolicus]TYP77523.1 acetyltransferase (GNAT) family protein [Paenibacillus methanolicus]
MERLTEALLIRPLRLEEEPPYELLLLADPSKRLVDAYLSKGRCHVAQLGDETIGVFLLLEKHAGTLEIMNIAVAERYQGRGFGKALLAAAVGEARKQGAAYLEIGTGNSGMQQLYMYQKCGFRMMSIDHDFFVRNYEEPIVENGIPCRDMVRLRMALAEAAGDSEAKGERA